MSTIKIRGAIVMNIVNGKLSKIKELGLDLHDNGTSYETLNYKAEEYAEKYLGDQSYTIGSVMSHTESLAKAEHDVCFQIVEDNYDHLTSDYYHSLHELAEGNDAQAFVEYLDKLHIQHREHEDDDDTVYSVMAEQVRDYMTDIENELDEIILSLGGEI